MKQARRNHTIGLAGGVLSAAGLCLGILSIGKKTDTVHGVAQVPSTPSKPEPIERLVEPQREPDHSELPESVPVIAAELHEPQPAAPEEFLIPEIESAPTNPLVRTSREMIADLARQGQAVVAIAQMLGISVGEVQLTLKLQERTASAGRRL